ncbi:acyltransferase [Pedobacter sp. FW305-3-2-15-E-R2A2]|uniref:acyltransferase n=1 Tax=Pedobacter sp. FW305-3-2-15-E-R2A2 TaxID=3140251 RepID=UPI00313FFD22
MNRFQRAMHMLKTILLYRTIFKKIGYRSIVINPLKIENGKNILIANNVLIGYKSWLAASPLTGESECILEIGEGCSIGNFNHIYSTKQIILEKNVLTADKVYISDNLHGYKNVNLPIIKQPIVQNNIVVIGEGSWIGENVCVLGVKIGKNCVIGANSVVTKDIPDYCVAVGSPAKIIKRYCFDTNEWLKTDKNGNFINEVAI